MKSLFVYSIFHSVTGEFLASVKFPTLNECRSWKNDFAKSLGLPVSGVYGRYHVIHI